MNLVLIGNIVSFIGCSLMVYVGLIKEKSRILSVQCVQFAIQGAANFILGGTNGVIANIVSIFRNLAFARFRNTVWLKLTFIALQLLLSFGSLGAGAVEWLPFLASVLFTWFLDLQNPVHLKIVIITTQIMWLIYDFMYMNYVSVIFDFFTLISTIIGIFLILRDKREATAEK